MEKEFRFFDFGLGARLVLAGGLYAAGAFLHLFLPALGLLGLAVSALGWAPLVLRRATNKPDDQGLEEWRLVSMAEIDRLEDSLRQTKKLRRKVGNPLLVLFLVFGLPAFLFSMVASAVMGRGDFLFVLGTAAVCLVPPLFFGRVSVFEPREIALKMPSFRAILKAPRPEGMTLAPYIRFDKDDKGRDVPEDLRFLIEPKRGPADLVGIQVQTAINNGPNGPVPYLYAVVLTRGRGQTWQAAGRIKARRLEVEAGGEGEYGTVVLRQDTANGGYNTSPEDCERLASACYAFLGSLGA